MNELLRFVYTGEFRVRALRIPELLIAANRFNVHRIFRRIAKEMQEALDETPKDTVKVVLRLLKVFVDLQLHEDANAIKQR
ncbi:hypothetical protein AAVH_10645 [Aphelenchoides avenae]|nr:hypothetical protein AAVH_10645 [Aphelenchus avenae]